VINLLAKLGFAEGVRAWVYPQSIGRAASSGSTASAGGSCSRSCRACRGSGIGGTPLPAANIPERRLYAFGAILHASDTVLILILCCSLAFALFFFTSLFDGSWCGYACPRRSSSRTHIAPSRRSSRATATRA
jgi:hypothetical protein